MVAERAVLLRIKHFKQRRRRIAAEVHRHLVDLVQQEHRIGRSRRLHTLDDASRHGADISSAVAADFRLVPHAAQRDADELAAQRPGDGPRDRRLADARRPDKAQDRPLQAVDQLLHGEVFKHALLRLLEAVMVLVQHRFGAGDVQVVLGALPPRQREQPVDVVADDARLGRRRRHPLEPVDFLGDPLAHVVRHVGLFQLGAQLLDLARPAFLVAKLFLDRLHLLAKVIFLLRLLHLLLDALADLALELEHFALVVQQIENFLEPLAHVDRLEDVLFVLDLQRQMAGDDVREPARLVDVAHGRHRLRRHFLRQVDIVFELAEHRAHEGVDLGIGRLPLGQLLHDDFVELVIRDVLRNLGARQAFHQHADRAVRQLEHLPHPRNGADTVNVVLRRFLDAHLRLGTEQDRVVADHAAFQRPHRLLPADIEVEHHARIDEQPPERQQRQAPSFPLARYHASTSLNDCTARRPYPEKAAGSAG